MSAVDDWKPWLGGDWDGDPDTMVYVRFKDGEETPKSWPARRFGLANEASNWRPSWGWSSDCTIIAYRVDAPLKGEAE